MLTDQTVGYQLYQNRELDEIDLVESTLTTITNDPNHEYADQLCEKRPKKYSYQFHFNFQKFNDDGTPDDNWNKAVANEAFRRCMLEGVDLTTFFARTNAINPLKCENLFYTMQGVCYNTSGKDYTELVRERMGYGQYDGETPIRTRNTDIAALKQQAMDELSAIGVTFPVHCTWPILAGATDQQDTAVVLRQCFSDSLGDDFVVLDIIEYVSSVTQEIVNAHRHSIIGNGWGADFGDPINFLGQEILHDDNAYQEILHDDNAYYAMNYGFIGKIVKEGSTSDWQSDVVAKFEEFTTMVNDASAIVDDIDARYDAFADAEAYMLQHALTMPAVYEVSWCLSGA